MPFLIRTVVTAASLALAAYLLPGIDIDPPAYGFGQEGDQISALLLSAVALGVLNAFVRPVLIVLSLPITILTLGLFILVINGLMLFVLGLIPFLGFRVSDLLSAIIGGLVVSVVSLVLNSVIRG